MQIPHFEKTSLRGLPAVVHKRPTLDLFTARTYDAQIRDTDIEINNKSLQFSKSIIRIRSNFFYKTIELIKLSLFKSLFDLFFM